MKTLKFDHELARQILAGEKTSTWRLFDDKDLSVNDDVKIIDKIDPERPETWKVIGIARITMVVQKRLGDVESADFEGHTHYQSKHEMLKEFQQYYGSDVNFDTVVKIVRFDFSNNTGSEKSLEGRDAINTSVLTEVKLYTDGGSRGNPGPSASGYAIFTMGNELVVKKGTYLGITTNNQAEYQALKSGLEEAARMHVRTVHVYMDSMLVVNQMLGIFKVKNRDLWPIHAAIKEIAAGFNKVTYTHVPRNLNKIADAAVNETLDHAENH